MPIELEINIEQSSTLDFELDTTSHDLDASIENVHVVKEGGTTDYEMLDNKPTINDVELVGNVKFTDFVMLGHGLKYDNSTNELELNMAENIEKDNTLPVSSADVYEVVGNIGVLLETI